MNDNISGDLLTIDQLAVRLSLKRRGVECLMKRRAIPFIRLSRRCIRFRWREVEAALTGLTILPVGEPRRP
jgi:excisionase family DNA binding protein